MAGASIRAMVLCAVASLPLAVTAAAGCSADELRHTPPLGRGGGGPGAGSGIVGVCTDGATRECHITIAQHGGVLTCYAGVETCSNGRWGACADGTVQNFKAPPESARGELGDPQGGTTPLALSDAGACKNNPCDPTCQRFDETPDGGLTPEAGAAGGGTIMGANGMAAYPSGWQRNPNVCQPSVAPPKSPNCPGVSPWFGLSYCDGCSYDTHCSGPNGTCVQNKPNASSGPIQGCSSPQTDITTLYPCLDAGDIVHIPVCNRGAEAVTDLVWIGVYSGASNIPSCTNPFNFPDRGMVSYDASQQGPILPGQCVDVHFTRTSTQPDGNIGSKINWGISSLPKGNPQRAIAANWNAGTHECNYCNNWSVWNGDSCGAPGQYTKYVYTDTLTASCPAGTRVQWTYLNYTAEPPPANASGSASIAFAVQTAPLQPDGGAGTFSPASPATVATIGPDPASCVLPCTKDIYTPLGLPAARDEVLNVAITFNPTPDGKAAPTVDSWSVSYSCPPSE